MTTKIVNTGEIKGKNINKEQDVRGLIFDIQRFCVHDGPGIRTIVFMKGCTMQCLWCSNPEGLVNKSELMYYYVKCNLCKKCIQVCSKKALEYDIDKDCIIINKLKCNLCGDCIEVCSPGALSITGQFKSVDDCMEEIKKDKVFYKNSGGGVTVSGGEPFLQDIFTMSLLKACKEEGFHTAVETCGNIPFTKMEKSLPYIDHIFFDIKHMDESKHIELTGVSNDIIKDNFKKLVKTKKSILPRLPLIPDLNDSEDSLEKIITFIKDSGLNFVEIIPYHEYGLGKYKALQKKYLLIDMKKYEDNEIKEKINFIQSLGMKVVYCY